MPQRIYPDQAPDQGSFVLTGNGSTNDVFTVTSGGTKQAVPWVVQNNSSTIGYVDAGNGTAHGATPGNDPVPANGGVWQSPPGEDASWLALYGAAGTTVNGTAPGGFNIYADI